MKKPVYYFTIIGLLLCGLMTACSENVYEEEEFADWEHRNTIFFQQKLAEAKQAIAEARSVYGEAWEEHCDWRVFRTYAQIPEDSGKPVDSICVKILERGSGSGCPIYTDSVRVNYIGRLIPSASYPEGYVFDHSGPSMLPEDVFHPLFSHPTGMLVSNTVEGFSTALQQMHIGDRWCIYIPYQMGYGASSTTQLPAYSTLNFEVQLKAYCRAGSSFQ